MFRGVSECLGVLRGVEACLGMFKRVSALGYTRSLVPEWPPKNSRKVRCKGGFSPLVFSGIVA